jgi:rare lipoprotein A
MPPALRGRAPAGRPCSRAAAARGDAARRRRAGAASRQTATSESSKSASSKSAVPTSSATPLRPMQTALAVAAGDVLLTELLAIARREGIAAPRPGDRNVGSSTATSSCAAWDAGRRGPCRPDGHGARHRGRRRRGLGEGRHLEARQAAARRNRIKFRARPDQRPSALASSRTQGKMGRKWVPVEEWMKRWLVVLSLAVIQCSASGLASSKLTGNPAWSAETVATTKSADQVNELQAEESRKSNSADAGCSSGRRGIAASYGQGQRTTSSGERFDPRRMTAAHRTLPFGTRLTVTNLRTGKSVIVVVNDRGPYTRRMEIDLSIAAAKAIGLNGTTVVCIE